MDSVKENLDYVNVKANWITLSTIAIIEYKTFQGIIERLDRDRTEI